MLQKFIKNKDLVTIIASIVGIALVAPDIIGLLGQEITTYVYHLVLYATLVCALVYVLVYALLNKELDNKSLICPLSLLYAGPIVVSLYNILEAEAYSNIYYLALYTFAIVIFILFVIYKKTKLKIAVYVTISIILAFNLVSVFTGSANSLARLIMGLLIVFNLHVNSSKEKKEESKNENI